MAKHSAEFVDISSSTDVNKVYYPDAAARAAKRKRRKKVNLTVRIVTLVLSIVMLFGGTGLVVLYGMEDKFNYQDTLPTTNKTGETTSVSVVSEGSSLLSSENVLNILIFGQDSKGSNDQYGRSDTTILMSIDNVHKKIKLTSFQRDTYVSIPGYYDSKINAAFTLGGEALSIDTIQTNFGIKVDKYATVDFNSFRKIIAAIGGIDMELNLEEIEYINAQIDVNNQLGKTQFIEYDTTKELQTIHLDGYQALWYARDRGADELGGVASYSFSGDDWDRTQRQRKLIEAIIKYMRTKASISDLVAIINEVGPLVTTNLKKNDITFLVSNIMTYIGYDMEQLSIPSQDTWRYGKTDDGQSVIVISDWDKARYDLAYFIYQESVVASDQNTGQ